MSNKSIIVSYLKLGRRAIGQFALNAVLWLVILMKRSEGKGMLFSSKQTVVSECLCDAAKLNLALTEYNATNSNYFAILYQAAVMLS